MRNRKFLCFAFQRNEVYENLWVHCVNHKREFYHLEIRRKIKKEIFYLLQYKQSEVLWDSSLGFSKKNQKNMSKWSVEEEEKFCFVFLNGSSIICHYRRRWCSAFLNLVQVNTTKRLIALKNTQNTNRIN